MMRLSQGPPHFPAAETEAVFLAKWRLSLTLTSLTLPLSLPRSGDWQSLPSRVLKLAREKQLRLGSMADIRHVTRSAEQPGGTHPTKLAGGTASGTLVPSGCICVRV